MQNKVYELLYHIITFFCILIIGLIDNRKVPFCEAKISQAIVLALDLDTTRVGVQSKCRFPQIQSG